MSTPKARSVGDIDALGSLPQIDGPRADALTALYKVLANPHRLRLLHALARAGELPVTALAEEVGMSVQAVSNQLQRLADQRVLIARRQGNHAYYRIVDPCIIGLLELGICLVDEYPSR